MYLNELSEKHNKETFNIFKQVPKLRVRVKGWKNVHFMNYWFNLIKSVYKVRYPTSRMSLNINK